LLIDVDNDKKQLSKKVVNDTPTTEIPIEHNPSVVPQRTAPIILAPPQYPVNKAPNEASMSSVDSSSIPSSIDMDSIHVIPIQVPSKISRSEKIETIQIPSKISRPEKIETIPIKKIPVGEVSAVKETKMKVKQLKEKVPTTDTASSKRRHTTVIANIVKRAPSQTSRSHSQTSRSHSAHNGRRQVNYFSPSPSTQQWNVSTYYLTNYHKSNEEKQTKYITEIYDKATNRFIPTTC